MPSKRSPDPVVEVPSSDVKELLALREVGEVSRLVRSGKLHPTRKLPGLRGPYLFDRAEVIALAEERKAKMEATAARIAEALDSAETVA